MPDATAASRIGLNLPTWPLRGGGYASWPEMRQLARDAEALGVDTLWVPDHLLRTLKDRPRFGFWECWTILTATAEATSRIEIGPFIACTGLPQPGPAGQDGDDPRRGQRGRLVLGLGSGVPARDLSWHAFGYDGERHVAKYARGRRDRHPHAPRALGHVRGRALPDRRGRDHPARPATGRPAGLGRGPRRAHGARRRPLGATRSTSTGRSRRRPTWTRSGRPRRRPARPSAGTRRPSG